MLSEQRIIRCENIISGSTISIAIVVVCQSDRMCLLLAINCVYCATPWHDAAALAASSRIHFR